VICHETCYGPSRSVRPAARSPASRSESQRWAGDNCVPFGCVRSCVGAQVLETHYARFGVEATFVDTCDVEAVRAAIKDNTVLLYLETPSNPTVRGSGESARGSACSTPVHSLPVCRLT